MPNSALRFIDISAWKVVLYRHRQNRGFDDKTKRGTFVAWRFTFDTNEE